MRARQGVLAYEVETCERADTMTARAGLPLVVEMMRALGMARSIKEWVRLRQRDSGYTEVEKIEAFVLLLASGGTCLEDINVLKADAGLCRLLDRKLPSSDTLRNTLYGFHDGHLIEEAKERRAVATSASASSPTTSSVR